MDMLIRNYIYITCSVIRRHFFCANLQDFPVAGCHLFLGEDEEFCQSQSIPFNPRQGLSGNTAKAGALGHRERQMFFMVGLGSFLGGGFFIYYKNEPLYEVIIYAAKRYGLSGATAFKGHVGFGSSSGKITNLRFWEITEKINSFQKAL